MRVIGPEVDRVKHDRIKMANRRGSADPVGMSLDLHFPPELDTLRSVWLRFAEEECGTYTPLYRQICEAVADDADTLQLTAEGPPHARQPNLLLAGVHLLVRRRHDRSEASPALEVLADLYAHGSGERAEGSVDVDAGAAFIAVVEAHRDELAAVLASRFTQTNECGRSAPLALALHRVASANPNPNPDTSGSGEGRPAMLAVIDAGCSAGLNLAVDRYLLDFGPAGTMGPANGTLVHCELTGPNVQSLAPLPEQLDVIGWRVGLERAPVDLRDREQLDWLIACVWPDHRERLARAEQALDALAADPPRVVGGDMVDDLAALIAEAPAEMLVTVVTSWAAAYLRPTDRERLAEVMRAASFDRPIVWLSMEAPGVAVGIDTPTFVVESPTSPSLVGTLRFDQGAVEATTFGWTHPHGAWFAPA